MGRTIIGSVNDDKYLDENSLYRAVKAHKALAEYNFTVAEIKAIFYAYSDILYTCLKNDIKVCFPYIGLFEKIIKKGFEGGVKWIPNERWKKGSGAHQEYFPPKPDYGIINLKIRPIVEKKFKEDTTVMGSELEKQG